MNVNVTSLMDRLRSVLEVYYDWVQINTQEDGTVHVRVGKTNPTHRDLEEFMLRVRGEAKNDEALTDVEVKEEDGEIVGVVSPTAMKQTDESSFVRVLRDYTKDMQIVENDRINLSPVIENVSVQSLHTFFEYDGLDDATNRVRNLHEFLTKHKFERVEEGSREDTYVRYDGSMARVNLVTVPGVSPMVRLSVFVPKTIEEGNLIRRHFGLSEVELVEPGLAKEAARFWKDMSKEERFDFLTRKVGLKPGRAREWSGSSFEDILDLHPFLARDIARELVAIRV